MYLNFQFTGNSFISSRKLLLKLIYYGLNGVKIIKKRRVFTNKEREREREKHVIMRV